MRALREQDAERVADGCACGLDRPVRHEFPEPRSEMQLRHDQ
jgi:hypothetical protein